MIHQFYITEFEKNLNLFRVLFDTRDQDYIHWKRDENAWSLLEILCHLRDEEIEDFRHRLQFVLEGKAGLPPKIHPQEWVTERSYSTQNFALVKTTYFEERRKSLNWLASLNKPQLDQFYNHPSLGKLNGHHFLNNWLAHDYLHIRQITRLRYDYLAHVSGIDLGYAGTWK
ncbi:MAG: DinB family protein [Saprospiraceae bacterium]|nr:DinB family protein [Saprospiraceae bacterium]